MIFFRKGTVKPISHRKEITDNSIPNYVILSAANVTSLIENLFHPSWIISMAVS